MSLIVSLRSPDGIVIAGDSLSTTLAGIQTKVKVPVECPQCKNSIQVDADVQLPLLPTSTFSFAQKIFPFLDRYGIGVFGQGQLVGKTIYFAIRELEKELKKDEKYIDIDIANALEIINTRITELLDKQYPDRKENAPDAWVALGYQLVGYLSSNPVTYEVKFGKNDPNINQITDRNSCTVSGDHRVVLTLWGLFGKDPRLKPAFEVFSIQDAIDYAEFLISTTAKFQRFSRNMATVGGEIDIGLVTPFDDFKWVKRKSLAKILETGKG